MRKLLLLVAILATAWTTNAQWVDSGVESLDAKWEMQVEKHVYQLEKEVGMKIPKYAEEENSEEFTWRFDYDGGKWGYLRGEWKSNCDRAIIALYDKDNAFLTKETLYMDFGTFETLVESSLGRRAAYAKIKCD